MVWGMREPSGFGDFFPDGEFTGHTEQIADHLKRVGGPELADIIDGFKDDFSKSAHVSDARFEAARKFSADAGDLEDHEQPHHFQTVKTYKNLGALIKTESRLLAVNEELKSIIEELEPGVHQFWPITITMPKGKTYPKQYYGMRIASFLDSFSPEDSKEGSWRDGSFDAYWGERIFKYRIEYPFKKNAAGLAMEVAVHKGTHLWREKKLDDPQLFFSDELHDAITSAGLRMPTFYKLKAV